MLVGNVARVTYVNRSVFLKIFVVVLSSGVGFSLGQPPSFPQSIDLLPQYLADQEIQYSDLIAGTEKQIVWFDRVGERSEYSVVYLHGFSASRQESVPYSDLIAKELQANLYYTRLTGHGRSEDAMLEGTAEKWIEDAELALKVGAMLGDKVIVIGMSTGSTLATYLAALPESEPPEAVILISPNYVVSDRRAYLFNSSLGRWLYKKFGSEYHEYETFSDQHREYWTERFPVESVSSMLDLLELVEEIDKVQISTPALFIYSEKDSVVSVADIEDVYKEWGSEQKQRVIVNDSQDPAQHVIVGDILSPNTTVGVAEQTVEFIKQLQN